MKIRNRIAAVILSAALVTGLTAPLPFTEGILTVHAQAATTVKAPKVSLKAGTYVTSSSKKVKLSCDTKGAQIYYSINNGSYKKYTKQLTISKNTTLKFYAKKNGVKSKVVTAKYKLCPEVEFSIEAGRYFSSQTIKLSSKLKDVTFYYTTDGSKPLKSSPKYTSAGIKIKTDTTLRVMAVKKNWTNNYESAEYKITNGSSILDNYKEKFFYQSLKGEKKALYQAICEGLTNSESYFELPYDYRYDDLEYVYSLVLLENPQLFYATGNFTWWYYEDGGVEWATALEPGYYWDADFAADMRSEMDAAAVKVLKSIPDGADDFTTLVTLHDWLVKNVTYTLDDLARRYMAYGALADGEAVCSGYSAAFTYMCQLAGIQCVDITGATNDADNANHEWNRVLIDGEWYNMDVTWDDPDSGSEISHCYFCVTDAFLEMDHTPDDLYPFGTDSTADCTDMNYFENLNVVFYTDAEEAYEALIENAVESYQDGVYVTGIYCTAEVKNQIYSMLDNFDKDVRRVGYTDVPHQYWASYKNDYISFKVQ